MQSIPLTAHVNTAHRTVMLKHRPLTLSYPEQTKELFFFSTVSTTAERLYLYKRLDLVTENSRLVVGFLRKKWVVPSVGQCYQAMPS